ncbi:MAG: SDR family oxidoreductase [Clostridiales bacterium]|jgi:NADP-dependent 3-hydroxy acid dehydrogenase YdfG|nr:SDR family oxidoreductase [Clostridiales bacterium]
MKKTVIITGGSSGYGLAAAGAFKRAGYTVLITARHEDALQSAQKASGADYIFVQDVTDYDGWLRLKAFAAQKLGVVDVLVNNAGGGIRIKPVEEQTRETIDQSIALNLTAVIYSANVFVPQMKARKRGTMINVTSVCATHAWPSWSVYAAAKSGVRSFTKGMQTELQPFGVRATCIIPASCGTNFSKSAGTPAGVHSLTADDIANTILYAAELPETAIMEEVTVWGMSQMVQPL